MSDSEVQNIFGESIFSYTREQAIDDGVLVDVSETALEAGFLFPVAMTSTVWDKYVTVPEGVHMQDEKGRLWDIVSMLRFAIRKSKYAEGSLLFELLVRNDNVKPKLVRLKSVCSGGDNGEPVITIMLPNED